MSRGTGFAGPQAGGPLGGAANHTQWGAWGPYFLTTGDIQ